MTFRLSRWVGRSALVLACVASLGVASCRRKPVVEEAPPPKPDQMGRMPMTNQGSVGQPGGGQGQVTQPQTD